MSSWKSVASIALAFLIPDTPANAADSRVGAGGLGSTPIVASAEFQLLPRALSAGNAVLRVSFADGRARTPVPIGPRSTYLRDDGAYPDTRYGDGIYAAIVNVNVEQYTLEQRRRAALAGQGIVLPKFSMRELVGFETFKPSRIGTPLIGQRVPLDKFFGIPSTVDPARELLISDPSVVEDPARTYDACTQSGTQLGAWTFGRLVTEIANEPATGIRPGDLAEHWVQQWTADLNINSFIVFNRQAGAQILLDNWPRLPDGQLDVGRAPFRLLAIVNRLDLRGSTLYGAGSGGEARLVFGALDCNGAFPSSSRIQGTTDALAFTVILEYAVPASGCVDVRGWAQQWHALGDLALGSPAYNAALQAITDQFVLRDAMPERTPNGSALNQARTNEFAFRFNEAFWELRESRLNLCGAEFCLGGIGLLEHKTIAQTPAAFFQAAVAGRALQRDFINANEATILAGAHQVPLVLPTGENMRGGNIEPGSGFPWNPGMVDLEARHHFSNATCNGCHTSETGTDFLHIVPRDAGAAAQLSDFMTGLNMPKLDPVSGVPRHFDELLHRQQHLDATANMSCLKEVDFALEELFLQPLPPAFVH